MRNTHTYPEIRPLTKQNGIAYIQIIERGDKLLRTTKDLKNGKVFPPHGFRSRY